MKKIKGGKHWVFSRYVDEEEKILSVIHRHILVFKFAAAKVTAIGVLLPLVVMWVFPATLPIAFLWSLIGFGALAYKFIDWYFDVWLLTDSGVIDLERNGLFDMTSTRIDYHMMEGISYQIKGFIRTVFNYGDITIDKIGAQTSVVLKDSIKPRSVERLVMKYQERFISERSIKDHNNLKNMLADMIAYHMHNKSKI